MIPVCFMMTKLEYTCIMISALNFFTIRSDFFMKGLINVSLVELEQLSIELKELDKNIKELRDSL